MKLQHCWVEEGEWATVSKVACTVGNVSGYISSCVWFFVLLPQIYWNFKRQTTEGLSLTWALSNFVASLINCFFAFRADLPLFSRISASYMPILHGLLVLQFLQYHNNTAKDDDDSFRLAMRLKFALAVAVTVTVLAIEFASWGRPWQDSATNKLQWFAVLLWCIELFPQIYINFSSRSTLGQSSLTIICSFIGKSTDFVSAYTLDMPIQTVTLAFWSSSTAYINAVQMLYFSWVLLSGCPTSKTVAEDESAEKLRAPPARRDLYEILSCEQEVERRFPGPSGLENFETEKPEDLRSLSDQQKGPLQWRKVIALILSLLLVFFLCVFAACFVIRSHVQERGNEFYSVAALSQVAILYSMVFLLFALALRARHRRRPSYNDL